MTGLITLLVIPLMGLLPPIPTICNSGSKPSSAKGLVLEKVGMDCNDDYPDCCEGI